LDFNIFISFPYVALWSYEIISVLSSEGHQYDQEMGHSGVGKVKDRQKRRNIVMELRKKKGKKKFGKKEKKLKSMHARVNQRLFNIWECRDNHFKLYSLTKLPA
jgi:ribosomal protein S17